MDQPRSGRDHARLDLVLKGADGGDNVESDAGDGAGIGTGTEHFADGFGIEVWRLAIHGRRPGQKAEDCGFVTTEFFNFVSREGIDGPEPQPIAGGKQLDTTGAQGFDESDHLVHNSPQAPPVTPDTGT